VSSSRLKSKETSDQKNILNEFTILFLEFFATFNGSSFLLYEENILVQQEDDKERRKLKSGSLDSSDDLLKELEMNQDESSFLRTIKEDYKNITFSKREFRGKLFHLTNTIFEILWEMIQNFYNSSSDYPGMENDSNSENEINQLAYLLEIFLFHLREILGIHFITNISLSMQTSSIKPVQAEKGRKSNLQTPTSKENSSMLLLNKESLHKIIFFLENALKSPNTDRAEPESTAGINKSSLVENLQFVWNLLLKLTMEIQMIETKEKEMYNSLTASSSISFLYLIKKIYALFHKEVLNVFFQLISFQSFYSILNSFHDSTLALSAEEDHLLNVVLSLLEENQNISLGFFQCLLFQAMSDDFGSANTENHSVNWKAISLQLCQECFLYLNNTIQDYRQVHNATMVEFTQNILLIFLAIPFKSEEALTSKETERIIKKENELIDLFSLQKLTNQLVMTQFPAVRNNEENKVASIPWDNSLSEVSTSYGLTMRNINLLIHGFNTKIEENSLRNQQNNLIAVTSTTEKEKSDYFIKYTSKSCFGILSLIQFLFSLYFGHHDHNNLKGSSSLYTFYQSEDQVKYLREALQQLLSTGQWELGIELSNFILLLLKREDELLLRSSQVLNSGGSGSNSPLKKTFSTLIDRSRVSHEQSPPPPLTRQNSTGGMFESQLISLSPTRTALGRTPLKRMNTMDSDFFSLLSPTTSNTPGGLLQRNNSTGMTFSDHSPLPGNSSNEYFQGQLSPLKSSTSKKNLLRINSSYSNPMNSASQPQPQQQQHQHHSPVKKRKETFKNEMIRILSKFKDKLKFDGLLRLPKQYMAIRLLSTQPILLSSSFMNTDSSSPTFSHPFFSNLEIMNLTNLRLSNYNISLSKENDDFEEGDETASVSGTQSHWHEQWILFSFDLISYGTAAEYYSYDFLEVLQYSPLNNSTNDNENNNRREEITSLVSPLSFSRVTKEVSFFSICVVFLRVILILFFSLLDSEDLS
jgi:hypothetical protein